MTSALLLGLLIGMQHALEPDHMAAVASMISGNSSVRSMIKHGVAWGVGHATTLFLVSAVVLSAGWGFSGMISRWLEFAVGLMLIGLGAHVLWRLYRDCWHVHLHRHGARQPHIHFHSHRSEKSSHALSSHRHTHGGLPGRAIAVGVVHGMAGSAALVVLAAASFASFGSAMAYVLIFGFGTIAGMALLTAGVAAPLAWSARAMNGVHRLMQLAIGLATVALGSSLAYENGIALAF